MGDPQLEAAIERYNLFLSQTFWALAEGLLACNAALALAKRGRNIVQMFFLWGPGGIGLSQYTKAIAEQLGGDLHKYLDGNILFDDNELRKLIELVAAACAWTIQERPTGTKGSFRLDIWKRICSADGIAGRLPYAIITRMFHMIGWKRFELNHMPDLHGVKGQDLASIIRRSVVLKFRAKFFPKMCLQKVPPWACLLYTSPSPRDS